jgi:hypothetical protein
MSETEVPLIYTKNGNLPISDLELKTIWDFEPTGITFIEDYYQSDELVRRSVHRFQYPDGTTLNLTPGAING